MSTEILVAIIVAAVAVVLIGVIAGLVLARRRRISLSQDTAEKPLDSDRSGSYRADGGFSFSQGGAAGQVAAPEVSGSGRPDTPTESASPTPQRTETDGQPGVGDDAAIPRDSTKRSFTDISLPESSTLDSSTDGVEPDDESANDSTVVDSGTGVQGGSTLPPVTGSVEPAPAVDDDLAASDSTGEAAESAPVLDEIEPVDGRLHRLRGRLSRSQNTLGKGVLGLLGGGDLDDDSWEEIEDTLISADLGTTSTLAIVEDLREGLAASSVRTADEVRTLFRSVLISHLMPELDRSIRALPHADVPAVLLVVGVNGTGKTTTVGKLARVLVADGRRVVLGAADTFRAAAADQLQTWGERVGAHTVRGREGSDPASVAFDAVAHGVADGVDVVVVDTAGRLHTKTGLMDELGKVKRVVEKKTRVDEVLLVLDATTGQNGMAQAKVFAEVVDITGVVLTKLDGTAKGGIVFHVQRELGVPVKLVGLGEGADDLAPFEPAAFVDALLG